MLLVLSLMALFLFFQDDVVPDRQKTSLKDLKLLNEGDQCDEGDLRLLIESNLKSLNESDHEIDYVPTISDVEDIIKLDHSDPDSPNVNHTSTAVREITTVSESSRIGETSTSTINEIIASSDSTAVDDKFYDLDNAKIYVKKPAFTISHGKKKRKQNQKHACGVCGKLVLHLGEHIFRHQGVEEVDNIIRKKKLNKSRVPFIDQEIFRNRGDHQHNLKVVANKSGELILSRRPAADFRTEDFGPCPKCYLWMLKANLPHHLSSCVCNDNSEKIPSQLKASLSTQSDMIVNRMPTDIPKLMINEVLGKFRNNAASSAARQDVLILLLGKHWWTRSKGIELTRRRYVAEKMLRAGRLLNCSRDLAGNMKLTMWELLRPKYFDILAKSAIKITCPQYEGDEEDMPSPSAAIKAKYDVSRMVQDKIMVCAKKSDESDDKHVKSVYQEMKCQAEEFANQVRNEWRFKVTSIAEAILKNRAIAKIDKLPLAEDLQILNEHLVRECNALDVTTEQVTFDQFVKNRDAIGARLYIFNRRRPLEVAGIKLTSYNNRKTSADIDDAVMKKLTGAEKRSFDELGLLQTKGKGQQIVPVLIPPECEKGLEWVATPSVREAAGVQANEYIFASDSKSSPVFSPTYALRQAAYEAGCKYPERIGGVLLRHYMATLTQAMSLTEFQFQHVLKHLGHSRKVHLENYRIDAPIIERVELGKILMMQDRNVQNEFTDIPLSSITFESILNASKEKNSSQSQRSVVSTAEDDTESHQRKEPDEEPDEDSDEELEERSDDICAKSQKRPSDDKSPTSNKKARIGPLQKRAHVSWSNLQDELRKLFSVCYDSLKTPRRGYISVRLQQNTVSDELKSRGVDKILKKLSADINKMKKMAK